MAKKQGETGGGWRNRIVGHGEEAPDQLLANPGNWRVHPKAQQEALSGAIRDVGFIRSVTVNRTTGCVVDGHLRVALALRNGEPAIPVEYVELSEAEEAEALATLDPIAAMAAVDKEKLDALLREVETGEAGVQQMLAELAEKSGLQYGAEKPTVEDAGAQVDKAEELRVKWGVQAGQLWQLGEHRLICGDCTDRATVERVMGGERADATVTDPPYGVGVEYESFEDTLENVKQLIAGFMPFVLERLPAALTPGVPAMWDYPRPAWVGAWVHPASTSSGAWGFIGANPILYYGKDPYLAHGKGRRDCSLVLVSDRKDEDTHPVAKPLNVWEWLVERMTPDKGATVYEPFSGSGTTIIACEKLGRRCRAIEISPAYVAVALERYAQTTGKTPTLLTD